MKIKSVLIPLAVLFLITIGIGILVFTSKNQNEKKKDTPQIIVSILPQTQIVEKIVGNTAQVSALIPPGFSPATYEPSIEDMKKVSQADIYFTIGHIPFEKTQIQKLQEVNPDMYTVDTSKNNTLRYIEEHDHENEDEKHNGEKTVDPHVWLDPNMVQQQAEIIRDTLVQTYPENEELYISNYQKLIQELEELDEALQKAFQSIQGKTVLVYHPAFGYLADRYGFTQEHIEIEGKEPSVQQLQTIIQKAQKENVHVVFVQKQFNQDSAKALAQNIGGSIVQIDPLDPNYIENITHIAQTITSQLK